MNFIKNYTNFKIYLVEIYLTKLLLQKLRNISWSLLITVYHQNGCTSKCINAINKICIMEFITIDESIVNCVLETDLVLQLEDQTTLICLDKIDIDISYNVSSAEYSKNEINRYQKIMRLTKLYNSNINMENFLFPLLNYEVTLDVDAATFMKTFFNNCYHSMNINVLNEFVEGNRNKVEFSVYYGQQQKYYLTCDKNCVIISAGYEDLYSLKKYFFKVFHKHKQNYDTLRIDLTKFKNSTCIDVYSVKLYYNEIRKLWKVLPV